MNSAMLPNPNNSATTCRIAPPADERFDEEAFLLREIAEAKAAFGRTVTAVKDHATHELAPQRLLRKHPLATAGAVGLAGLLFARRIFRSKRRPPQHAQPQAAPAQKAGLLAMLIPAVAAIIQSLTAAKMTNAQSAAPNPQGWMVNTLWGLARDRFGSRGAAEVAKTPAPIDGLKAAASRAPAAEPLRDRRSRPR
jgi:hypothetical protein